MASISASSPLHSQSERRSQAGALMPAVALAWLQGSYFFLTGIWPIVHLRSFLWVTGPKTDHLVTGREEDHWLLMTVSVLIVSVGLTLLVSAYRRSVSAEIATLAIAASLGLTAIDVIYVARQVIWPIYLLDAVIEVILISAWLVALAAQPRLWRPAAREGAFDV
jgi:hypothetical protein